MPHELLIQWTNHKKPHRIRQEGLTSVQLLAQHVSKAKITPQVYPKTEKHISVFRGVLYQTTQIVSKARAIAAYQIRISWLQSHYPCPYEHYCTHMLVQGTVHLPGQSKAQSHRSSIFKLKS